MYVLRLSSRTLLETSLTFPEARATAVSAMTSALMEPRPPVALVLIKLSSTTSNRSVIWGQSGEDKGQKSHLTYTVAPVSRMKWMSYSVNIEYNILEVNLKSTITLNERTSLQTYLHCSLPCDIIFQMRYNMHNLRIIKSHTKMLLQYPAQMSSFQCYIWDENKMQDRFRTWPFHICVPSSNYIVCKTWWTLSVILPPLFVDSYFLISHTQGVLLGLEAFYNALSKCMPSSRVPRQGGEGVQLTWQRRPLI